MTRAAARSSTVQFMRVSSSSSLILAGGDGGGALRCGASRCTVSSSA